MCINMFLRLVKCGSWTPLGAARLYVGQYEREDAAKALRGARTVELLLSAVSKMRGAWVGNAPSPTGGTT